MPRANLPNKLKSLKTMYVNITQTTEEEVWNHIRRKFEELKPMMREAKTKQNYAVEWARTNNPYSNYSWSDHGVTHTRHCFNDIWTQGQLDKWNDYQDRLLQFLHDYNISKTYLKWDVIRNEDLFEFEKEVISLTRNCYDKEYELYDKENYNTSYKNWRKRNADKITEKALEDVHKFHETYKDDCKLCNRKKEIDEARIKYEKEEEQRLEEANRRFQEDKERLRAEQKDSRHLFECEICNYQTYNAENYDKHEESKEHLRREELRKFYCKTCNITCRTGIEYTHHINTRKHKIAIGEISKEIEFKCDLCNYVTHTKQNLDKHYDSKYHLEKINLCN